MKSRDREMFKVGPIGSIHDNHKSLEWDEKGRNMISSIYVAFDSDGINCIQFSYPDQNGGDHVVSERYGASADTMKKKYKAQSHEIVRLKDDEFVIGLSAIHCMELTSLNIHTNQGKHGPICHKFTSVNVDHYKRELDVKIRDRREFGGFFGSFDDCGNLTSIGIYVCPITRISDAPLRTNYKVTQVADDDDDDDQPTLYQSSDHPLATVNHNETREYPMPHDHEVSDGYHVKAIAHKPKFEDKMSLYQSSDLLARSTNNRTLEYQMPHEFSDGYHVEPFGRTPKLEDGIFSKLERLFGNLLD
ncbi:PREDICTED: jacalin-related lectin 25-like isoform X2 [Camelina sativa]|uniref:Jacalin-related lectin 25-like isoform X2 n=1 Tax=Camelina sativa TaxID=90675 RepID=A0ABM0YV01_CAMSA|nr:PREDICTED: jacalin-related lectin 25-like isoform X2 [Camelina sativa]